MNRTSKILGSVAICLIFVGAGLVAADTFGWFVKHEVNTRHTGTLLVDGVYAEDVTYPTVELTEENRTTWINHTIEYIGSMESYTTHYYWNATYEGFNITTTFDDVVIPNSGELLLSNDGEHTMSIKIVMATNISEGNYPMSFYLLP